MSFAFTRAPADEPTLALPEIGLEPCVRLTSEATGPSPAVLNAFDAPWHVEFLGPPLKPGTTT